jgi:glucokinase
MLLAADVGGTNARLALYADDGVTQSRVKVFVSHEHESFEAVAHEFLAGERGQVGAAVVGVAGPVVDGRCVGTNLAWVLDERRIAAELGIPRVRLINDLVALALGAVLSKPEGLTVVHGGRPPRAGGANLAVIAAGTGLGEAILVWDVDAQRYVASATEGGHADFAPRTTLEWELLSFLTARFGGHVSWERVVSGPGIGNLYDFFKDHKGVAEDAAAGEAIAKAQDRNREIAKRAADRTSAPAERAIELFASLYGSEAGNLALKSLAVGGVFVAGGIAAGLAPRIESLPFVSSFRDKGRLGRLLEEVPIAIVKDSSIGLSGSASLAARLVRTPAP